MIHTTFKRLPEDKKERILLAAQKEFADYPFEKTSINRILEEARIPKGSFYQYFDDKVDLFFLCIYSVYEKLILLRQAHGESLLDSGLGRMNSLGYEKGFDLFSQDLSEYLEGYDFALFKNMLDAPAGVRNHVLMRIGSELIAPVYKEELLARADIRKDIDFDYYSYLLSLSEMISVDYGTSHGYTMEQIMYLAYTYMKSIFDSVLIK